MFEICIPLGNLCSENLKKELLNMQYIPFPIEQISETYLQKKLPTWQKISHVSRIRLNSLITLKCFEKKKKKKPKRTPSLIHALKNNGQSPEEGREVYHWKFYHILISLQKYTNFLVWNFISMYNKMFKMVLSIWFTSPAL